MLRPYEAHQHLPRRALVLKRPLGAAREAFLAKILPRRLKPRGLVKRPDMEVRQLDGRQAFAGQG